MRVLGSGVGVELRYDMRRQAGLLTRIEAFNLSRRKEHPVFSILRSSFDSLEEEDQLLFFDVVLFVHCVYFYPSSALEWLGMVHGREVEVMLECLKRRSLLELFDAHRDLFRMHDLWREFAAAEVKDGKFKGRRLICVGVSGKVDLTEFPKVGAVRVVAVEDSKDVALDVRGLKHLKSLEVNVHWYMGVNSVSEVNGLGTLEELTYLCCDAVGSSACIAELGCLTNLQVMSLVGSRGDKLPDMTKLTNLRRLELVSTKSLQSVCLRNLANLMHLELGFCDSLRIVDISGCRSMVRVAGLFGSAELEELNVSCCPLLPSLDHREEYLVGSQKLWKLDITGCCSLQDWHELSGLEALEELRTTACESLDVMPRFWFPKLRVLEVEPTKVPWGFE